MYHSLEAQMVEESQDLEIIEDSLEAQLVEDSLDSLIVEDYLEAQIVEDSIVVNGDEDIQRDDKKCFDSMLSSCKKAPLNIDLNVVADEENENMEKPAKYKDAEIEMLKVMYLEFF